MRINELVWLPDIVDKIEVEHHLEQYEVEQVFFNRPSPIDLVCPQIP